MVPITRQLNIKQKFKSNCGLLEYFSSGRDNGK